MNNQTRWLSVPRPQPAAPHRLFCFPYAGSGASGYHVWAKTLAAAHLEVCAIQLPGRENRLSEPACEHLDILLPPLLDALEPHLDRPFGFFGHSMGTLLAFEAARALRDRGWPTPRRLFLSAGRPPHLARTDTPLHGLPDDAFLAAIVARYQGIPAAVLEHRELLDLILPTLRADITLLETYRYRPAAPLAAGFSVFGGRSDPRVDDESLRRWRDLTEGPFLCETFDGGHFYLNDVRPALTDAIARCLADEAGSGASPGRTPGRQLPRS
ncbi:MAG: thioesterase domain-containing protein [Vicinamibacterales bacterium]|nr:thioesterase domain-containing protein [Vicinamibacterales bacterium]MDP7478437.1 thioesterase domain-containing protein [Vicinamibacterales bacterium]MDP7690386.1 thioesterase domain-containing protein [Vicinamibacterales bacterium]HJN44684.1 thioesterase domain-containing protein [Vicinamibacterales bacterium]